MRLPKHCRMILIDANSMFTSIPVLKTIDIMYESLIKSGHTFGYAEEFEKLLLLYALSITVVSSTAKLTFFRMVSPWEVYKASEDLRRIAADMRDEMLAKDEELLPKNEELLAKNEELRGLKRKLGMENV